MTTHQLSLNECNTPWWYETPSLASQSTFSSNTYCTGTSQIDPFDITPSQSSGYYDEDTTASEASSNMFTGGPGSCATGSEWSDNGSSTRSAIKSTRSNHRPPQAGGAGGGACLCEHCDASARVHHGQVGRFETQTQTQTTEHSNTSEVLIAPVSPTMPISSFNSMEGSDMGPTPSTCTELNGLVDSQDGLNEEENCYNGESYDSSLLSDGDQKGSQLSHSMASTNQQILRELARDLMQHIDSIKLFPYLQRNSLLTNDDMDYICNPRRTENERRRRIIISAPCHDPDAFDRFVDCLSVERSHQGHVFLAKRMREAIKKKRENPFKTMSSLRNKKGTSGRHHSEGDAHSVRKHSDDVRDQLSSSAQSSPKQHRNWEQDSHTSRTASSKSQSPKLQTSASVQHRSSGASMRHGINSSNTTSSSPMFGQKEPSPSPYEIPILSATMVNHITTSPGQPHYSRRSPSSSSGSTGYAYTPSTNRLPPDEQDATLSEEEYERSFYETYKRGYNDSYNQPGGYSSLPRQFSNSNVSSLNRCSPAYSSARYQVEQKRKPGSLNRHGSFHSRNDMSPSHLVSPLTRSTPSNDSTMLSYDQRIPRGHDYQRKYSLPVTTQHGPTFTTSTKSHSGSQLPSVRSSPYPPLQEDMGSTQISSHSRTQRDYLTSDATLTEYGFPTFYSQWEDQNATTHPPQQYEQYEQYEVPGRNYQRPSPSLSDSRSRHPSLPPESGDFNSRHPSLEPDDYLQSIADLQGDVEGLSLQSHQSSERTHRRSRSCDASKAQQEGLVPSPHEEMKSRHHSLIRRQHRPSYEEVKRERIAGKETGDTKLIKRKILWLQEKVQFTDFLEEMNFLSLTHYRQPRNILYSGTLYEHGKPRFVVLLTDILLILKPKKKIKMNMVQSKLGVQMPQLDWFSDLGCKAKRPFFLHLMMVQRKLKKYSSECFCIRYNNQSEMIEVTFQAVSKEAKEIWVESLSQAIRTCTEDNANSILPVGNPSSSSRQSGHPYTKLSLAVLQANNLALSSSNCKTRNHYCSIHLGGYKCRTPSVKAKCWPSWNFQFVFFDFALTETVHVGFFAERSTCPDDFLGNVEIDLTTLAQSQRRQLQPSTDRMSKLLFKNQVYPLMNGKGTLTFDIELGWDANM